MGHSNAAQVFALVAGVTYAIVGVVGFAVTGFEGVVQNGPDTLLGFDLNPFHNVVHFTIGLGFIVASRLDATLTQGIVIGGGLVYLLAALLGFLNQLQILSINDEIAPDNFLHLVSGSAAVLFGLIGARQTDAMVESSGRRARRA
jgi:hypothetical protein